MANVPDVIELNVGGVLYATSRTTLTRDSTSLLGRWFSANAADASSGDADQQQQPPLRDSKGRYFLDRDGVLFRFILDYLRTGRLVLPEAFSETNRLRNEADFYGLSELSRSLPTVGAGGSGLRLSPSGQLAMRAAGTIPSNGDGSWAIGAPLSPGLSDTEGGGAGGRPEMGYVVVGYRGTFQFGRDGLTDVKFRKISRILVSGRVSLCRDVFGDTLNESRDPDRGSSDRYSARFFLKHAFIEQAFDALQESGFRMVGACASGTNSAGGDTKPGMDSEENRWNHYNEFVFCRP